MNYDNRNFFSGECVARQFAGHGSSTRTEDFLQNNFKCIIKLLQENKILHKDKETLFM